MKLRFPVLVLALLSLTVGASAQINLYFNPLITRVSNSKPDSGPFAFLGQNETSQIFGGVDLGGGYTFYHAPKFDAGIDMREEIEHGNSASLDSFLVGAQIQGKLAHSRFRPYLQLSGGAGRSKSPLSPIHATKFEVAAFVGADYPINKHVDFRVIEVGYGSVTTMSSSLYIPGTNIPAAQLLNFSTGFVFHIR